MTTQVYDVVIIGAGSIVLLAAWFLAHAGLRPLIRDQSASPGQGSNKTAISGIRATHCAPAKIRLCLEAIDFGEHATGIIQRKDRVVGVRTERGEYGTEVVINAAGAWARAVACLAHLDVPVVPDSHEAGITQPVARFLEPLVVDIRPARGSKNCYFYQHRSGSLAFCITPDPPRVGTDFRETSTFLPMIARRMVELMPKLVNLKVRRTWRGLYPMTPDGLPIVGWAGELEGYAHAIGMGGQGFMLGPGVGAFLTRMIQRELTPEDENTMVELSPYRNFGRQERLA